MSLTQEEELKGHDYYEEEIMVFSDTNAYVHMVSDNVFSTHLLHLFTL